MRTYERTHPWITFQLDLRKASHILWMFLGEAQSKCQHIAGIPLLPEVANSLYGLFLAKGALATTAIEGNTLTEDEVLKHLEGKLELPPSKEYLKQEVSNIIEACNLILSDISNGKPVDLKLDTILLYNSLVLKDLPVSEEVIPGSIRKHIVGVGGYRGAPPEDCQYLLEKFCVWLNNDFDVPGEEKKALSILKAIIAHIYIAWIHPFGDGNGRTARLIEFQILLSAGMPATAAHLLSNHYNQTRSEYYRQLDLTHKAGGNIFSFIEYALQGFIDGLAEQIELVKRQQLHVHWINYIHDRFRDKDRPSDIRKRRVVIDLSSKDGPVPISEIRHISPRIAESYAGKTERTIKRDINALVEMDLIERTSKEVRPKTETMLAFLPPTRIEETESPKD